MARPMGMADEDALELATGQAQDALDRAVTARDAKHPDHAVHARGPRPPAWHPDPQQAPVTTRQDAEVARLRAGALRQEGHQVRQQVVGVHHATQGLHAFLRRPLEDRDPRDFIRINPAAVLERLMARHRQ